jgi:hypothetical protein
MKHRSKYLKAVLCSLLVGVAMGASEARAQVQSLTLGVNVNCPSGLGECFFLLREGLTRIEGIESIDERANPALGTGCLRIRDISLLDPTVMAQKVFDVSIGASLRGMEATIDGTVEGTKDSMLLRFVHGGTNQTVKLVALKKKIQLDDERKGSAPPTKEEREAFNRLKKSKDLSAKLRLTGPMTRPKEGEPLVMEVRTFERVPKTETARAN